MFWARKARKAEIRAAIKQRVFQAIDIRAQPVVIDQIIDGMAFDYERQIIGRPFEPDLLTNSLLTELLLKQALKSQDVENKLVRQRKSYAARVAALQEVRRKHSWIVGLPIDQVVAAQRTMLHAEILLRIVLLFVPRRLVDEEFADAIEILAGHFKRSAARWPAYVKLVTATLWLVVHAVGYAASKLKGSKKASGE